MRLIILSVLRLLQGQSTWGNHCKRSVKFIKIKDGDNSSDTIRPKFPHWTARDLFA